MPVDLIRYDLLAQEALRGLVRKVLTDVARDGLKGDHHFYIAFDTRAPGVRISERLRAKYPEEITIILQHQFWDLSVGERSFEVGVSFAGVPERLTVPFAAIKGFFDPSVQFGLQFEVDKEAAASGTSGAPAISATPSREIAAMQQVEPPRSTPRGAASEPEETKPARGAGSAARKKAPAKSAKPQPADKSGADIVSIDKFRKK